jgi:hypothetical protein
MRALVTCMGKLLGVLQMFITNVTDVISTAGWPAPPTSLLSDGWVTSRSVTKMVRVAAS